MFTDEPVRGQVPPRWFWSLPGIERIRAFSLGQLPAPPLSRLMGIRPAHVGPGSGTWIMPAAWWLQTGDGEIDTSILAETAMTGVAVTTLPPGVDVEPLCLAMTPFRAARPQPGNLLARARVVNASRFFVFAECEIEDPQGRQIAHWTVQCEVHPVEPVPPPAPAELRPVEEPAYATPDPYLRAPKGEVAGVELAERDGGLAYIKAHLDGRFVVPLGELTSLRGEQASDTDVSIRMQATEWLCRYTRCISPGAIAMLANFTGGSAAQTRQLPGQSFAGLNQAVYLFSSVPADGRTLRAVGRGKAGQRGLVSGEVQVYDADGNLVAIGQGFGQFIDVAKRQRRRATETRRVLATLLFTDIVGSTQHAERLGDARWGALLEQHRNLVRAEIQRWEGTEIDTAGDGFFVRFDSPARALECANAVRAGVKRLGIDLRLGVHTGECEQEGRKLAGMAVHVAARIQASAGAGEVLVSSTVKDLAMGSALRFEDRGRHTLKDVPGEWQLFALSD